MVSPGPNRSALSDGPTTALCDRLCDRLSGSVDEEDIGSRSDETRFLPGTNVPENRGTAAGEPSATELWSAGLRSLIEATRTGCKVGCGGAEGTSSMVDSDSKAPWLKMMGLGDCKGSMGVSVVGPSPKAAGLKMGLGGLDERDDGGEGEELKGGSWDRVMIGGGGVGDVWVEGILRVTLGLAGGTGGGTRVGLAEYVRCEGGVGGAV